MRFCRILGVVVLPLAVSACQVSPPTEPVELLSEAPADTPAPPSSQPSAPSATAPTVNPGDNLPAPIPSLPDIRPLGIAGPRTAPRTADVQSNDFLPIEDRWRVGIPDNYIQNTRNDTLFDPFNQNVLKGDYPIPGTPDPFLLSLATSTIPTRSEYQNPGPANQFFIVTLTSDTLFEARRTPTPSGVSARSAGSESFFGNGDSQFVQQNFILSADYFIGDSAYRQRDFEIRATGVINANYVHTHELDQVSPNVQDGHDRTDYALAPQEFFVEKKLADLSTNFDIMSLRAGIQGFNNDFRGFLFNDNEPGVRLFGNLDNNRWQYNLVWFHSLEKDTHSGLNTLTQRDQNTVFANVYRQDFLFPGYTGQLSFAANLDHSGMEYDTDGFLVRPSPIGTIQNKKVDAYYVGWAGDGHIGRFNITHQFYQAFGRESYNEIAGREVTISAQFAAAEISYDIDFIRLRSSFLYSSGDRNPQSGRATGFDSIFDNPNFAGGGFSYFDRQSIPLTGTGVNLTNRESLIPDLRTSKEQGEANFVNPGLLLFNLGMDVNVTPELTLIGNASYLRFDTTAPLQLLLQDNKISRDIGVDLSIGVRYRPMLNNNLIITGGFSALVPGAGFSDLYTSQLLYSTFLAVTVTY